MVPILQDTKTGDDSFETQAVRVATARDKDAFAALFSYFAPRIKSYLLRHKLSDSLAEELAQDVMITFWQKADKFDPAKARFSTWIFRVARNRMIDHTRRKKYPEVNADDHLQTIPSQDRTDKPVEVAQDKDRITTAMTALSDKQRQVIELSFFEDLSHSQIAAKLSVPIGTVKSRIRIAFTALRKHIGDRQ